MNNKAKIGQKIEAKVINNKKIIKFNKKKQNI